MGDLSHKLWQKHVIMKFNPPALIESLFHGCVWLMQVSVSKFLFYFFKFHKSILIVCCLILWSNLNKMAIHNIRNWLILPLNSLCVCLLKNWERRSYSATTAKSFETLYDILCALECMFLMQFWLALQIYVVPLFILKYIFSTHFSTGPLVVGKVMECPTPANRFFRSSFNEPVQK